MGIPLYFKQLSEKYPNIIRETSNAQNLFLDLNCAIHPCCQKIIKNHSKSNDKIELIERRMITEVIEYIKKLLDLVNPSFLYIAIDGVAPCAKMNQQRLRRYKTIYQKELENKIKKEENIEDDIFDWNSSAISPGTKFMLKLTEKLNKFIKTLEIRTIFSDSNEPGEGEHKILNHIRENEFNDTIIYGLDADLIVLAFVSKRKNISLLREALVFGKPIENKFLYLDIDNLKYYITKDIRDKILLKDDTILFNVEKLNRIIDDYIFITFLIGNDFLPHLPAFSLRNNGLELLLNKYIDLFTIYEQNLVNFNKKKFNMTFIRVFLKELATIEDDILKKMSKKRQKFKLNDRPYESEYKKKIDLLNHSPIMNQEKESYINIGQPNWQYRYYNKCLKLINDEDIEQCSHNYLIGLVWNYEYYFNGCICWQWKYMYRHAPSLYHLTKTLEYFDLNKTKFKKNFPVSTTTQLLSILPKKSSYLIPSKHRNIMFKSDITHYYPEKFQIDTYFKRYFWECEPILPNIDSKIIEKLVK